MLRMRITALVLGALFLTSKWGLEQLASSPHASPLEGTWQITSVQRDGKADEMHAGSSLIFDVDEVRLQSAFELSPVPFVTLVAEESRKAIEMPVVY